MLIRALAQLLSRKRFNALGVAIFRTVEAFLLYSLSVTSGHIALTAYLVDNIIAGSYRPSVGFIIRKLANRGGDLGFHYLLRDLGAFTGTLLSLVFPHIIFVILAVAYLLSIYINFNLLLFENLSIL